MNRSIFARWVVIVSVVCVVVACSAAQAPSVSADSSVVSTASVVGPTTAGAADFRSRLCSTTERVADTSLIKGSPWKDATATTFFFGEGAGADNAGITNVESAWSSHLNQEFGGVDFWDGSANSRDGLCPKAFSPKQNPFYVALPVPDHDSDADGDGDYRVRAAMPWVFEGAKYLPELRQFENGVFPQGTSPFKNLWVQVRNHDGKPAFGQIEDVGPSGDYEATEMADYEYVLGKHMIPKNTFSEKAGIDLSPAMTDYLGCGGSCKVTWRLVPADQVPQEWKMLVTTSAPNWN